MKELGLYTTEMKWTWAHCRSSPELVNRFTVCTFWQHGRATLMANVRAGNRYNFRRRGTMSFRWLPATLTAAICAGAAAIATAADFTDYAPVVATQPVY